ncbi:MAG: hypothetical protein FWB95_09470 [Treponema sp.]|nr:hypothetical protein [Treponema sp.]
MAKIKEFSEYLSLDEAVRSAVKYCIEHNVLREFLKKHASEVLNMLFDELTIEEIAEIRAKEAREEAREEEKQTIARNLLAEGSTPEFVQKITGLSIEEIEKL